MLLGKGLRRGHERALSSGLDGAQERMQCDDRLARPHVALQQALHRNLAVEVVVDLGYRALLIRGQREGKRVAIAREEVAGRTETLCRGARAGARGAEKGEAQHEELVERESRAPELRLGE